MLASRPSLYKPEDAFANMYATRTAEFAAEGRAAGLRPVTKDPRRIGLIIVDAQWDFVHPTGTLKVDGSQDDMRRLSEFIYANMEEIGSIYASLDTHHEFQIFSDSWWVYMDNQKEHPAPFTMIGLNTRGEAVNLENGRQVLALFDPLWSATYLRELKTKAQKDLMIWPGHCLQGTMGHNLMPSLREALTFHASARLSQIQFLVKGTCPQVEHYGIFAAEVPWPKDPSTGMNTSVLDAIAQNDLIYVAGEAKSHCVLATMKQLVSYFSGQPDVIRKIRFLMDCTSSVVHPLVDFEAIAQAELATMAKLGVQLVTSTDTIG